MATVIRSVQRTERSRPLSTTGGRGPASERRGAGRAREEAAAGSPPAENRVAAEQPVASEATDAPALASAGVQAEALKLAVQRANSAEHELAKLRDELDQRRQEAAERGFREGYQKGLKQAETESAGDHAAVTELLESLTRVRESLIVDCEDELLAIAHGAVLRLLGDRLASEEGVLAAVRQVVAEATGQQQLTVRVSPRDFALLQSRRVELKAESGSNGLDLVADPRVELGGCLVESPTGTLDGRLEVQLQRLREALLGVRNRR
jgi:flagellar assembly protein FliH